MGMVQEFKEFAVKGNVIDLAVGVIIGGAFGKIVDSIVGDLIMPLIGAAVGKLDFSNLFVVLGDNPNNLTVLAEIRKAGIPVFAYGSFLTILVMPLAYSISEGIAIGVVSWTLINLLSGKAKEKKIPPLMYVLTVLFILKYIFL